MTLIAVVSAKGGQGKSTLSNAIALACGGGILTNEKHSSMDRILVGRFAKVDSESELPDVPESVVAIFDGKAGIHEPVVESAIRRADHVLIPIRPEGPEEAKRLAWALSEVAKMTSPERIAVVVTKATEAEFEAVRDRVGAHWKVPVFWLPNSVFFQELGDERFGAESLHQKAESKWQRSHLRNVVIPRLELLLEHLHLPIFK